MILYYALGGGLGHLTRGRAFLETIGAKKEAVMLTSSQYAGDIRVTGDFRVVQVDKSFESDPAAYRDFLAKIFDELQIETLFLDAFPVGIIGEFSNFDFPPNLEIKYLARLLKWRNYSPLLIGKTPKFEKTFVLENLEAEHQEYINRHSNSQGKFEITYSLANLSPADRKIYEGILKLRQPFWLIVHCGSKDEIAELLKFAAEMREIEYSEADLILISPDLPPAEFAKILHFDFYPASALFPDAERIFTGCGFNIMRQMKSFSEKHHCIPFERRYDDQFARAKSFRENTSFVKKSWKK